MKEEKQSKDVIEYIKWKTEESRKDSSRMIQFLFVYLVIICVIVMLILVTLKMTNVLPHTVSQCFTYTTTGGLV